MVLYCENALCIYQENNKCVINIVYLNALGMCEECICVKIEKDELNFMKKKVLDNFDEKDD